MNIQLNEAYEILGIKTDATLEDARKAYHIVAKKCHPDQVGGDNTQIRKIIEAFEVVTRYLNEKGKKELDVIEIRRTQAAARAKAQAKAREQVRREEERKKAVIAERIRRIKKVYSELLQSKEFKKYNLSEEYFVEHVNEPECSKWITIHHYASSIHSRRERYIKEYESFIDQRNKKVDSMVPFTALHPNPINLNKKKSYRAMINQKYGTIGDAISTVYKTFSEDINNLSKCLDFNDDSYISYLIGDEAYQNKIFKMAENKLASYYKILKYIVSKPECSRDIEEGEFLNVRSNKYRLDVVRMKNIEAYVNHVYTFREDGTIIVNNQNITRTEYQQAREWLSVVKTNNLGKVDRSAIIIYINYVAGCLHFIYDKIPHPDFNPNVSPDKLLVIAKVINTLEKYYILAQVDGITDCFNTYVKMANNVMFKDKKLSQILEELVECNKKRKVINKYYLHSYYSLEEYLKMSDDEKDTLYNRALEFKREIEEYSNTRKDNLDLVELYLKKLKDNKKFTPLFNDDVSFMDIMDFLEMKKNELNAIRSSNKPSLGTFIFYTDKELTELKEAPIYEEKKAFIVEHNDDYGNKSYQAIQHSDVNIELVGSAKDLDKMSHKQINQVYRDTVISFLNNYHPKYRENNLNNASYGRFSSDVINSLIDEAEDERVIAMILDKVKISNYDIGEEEIRAASREGRLSLLRKLSSEEVMSDSVSSPYTK